MSNKLISDVIITSVGLVIPYYSLVRSQVKFFTEVGFLTSVFEMV